MDPEGIMLSEISWTEKCKYCMLSLVCGIQEIRQTETDSQVWKTKLPDTTGEEGRRQGKQGVGSWEAQTAVYKIDKEQGYILQYREIQPLFFINFRGGIIYKNIESLCCTPENNIVSKLYFTIGNHSTDLISGLAGWVPVFCVSACSVV